MARARCMDGVSSTHGRDSDNALTSVRQCVDEFASMRRRKTADARGGEKGGEKGSDFLEVDILAFALGEALRLGGLGVGIGVDRSAAALHALMVAPAQQAQDKAHDRHAKGKHQKENKGQDGNDDSE